MPYMIFLKLRSSKFRGIVCLKHISICLCHISAAYLPCNGYWAVISR